MSAHQLNGSIESPRAFLDAAYEHLGYYKGELLNSAVTFEPGIGDPEVWLEKGDWLTLAQKVSAEKVFFVNNDPVLLFCCLDSADEQTILDTFRRVWCMARPQCVFIACPGELRVYSLNFCPVRTVKEWKEFKPLDIAYKAAEVGEKLQAFHREQIESGRLFLERNFGEPDQRADKRLILDLKVVRRRLLETEPKISARYIHALIGRSIFVRYLEDRGVLTPEYFKKVTEKSEYSGWKSKWLEIIETPEEKDLFSIHESRRFTRVLRNKDFTYALFSQLAEHFNGDMFPGDREEENAVTQEHIDLLRRLLLGDTDEHKLSLFLWAYDFEIIPIELISNIYEEFYHTSSEKDKGTHYTPSVLVEYVLSQLLTPKRLAEKPKILDFACGSGIFLVQAFRRIVRYQLSVQQKPIRASDLRQILREQITGVEINEEAVHVAAFSLYLALLNYQKPKNILAQIEKGNGAKPLPYLINDPDQPPDKNHDAVLFRGNSFSLMEFEKSFIRNKLEKSRRFNRKIEFERLIHSTDSLPFEPNSFDIIVGNPPWGYLKANEGTSELRAAQKHILRWCKVFNWPIGDKEMSQAFIARASSLLKPDGQCGLLVSAGVLLKRHENSVRFRRRWLNESIVQKIVNFTHVRSVFFRKSISPFCFIHFELGIADSSHRVQYWSVKKTEIVDKVRCVLLSLPDLRQVRQSELKHNDFLWKVYWWGGHRDASLIKTLNMEECLSELVTQNNWNAGRGFEKDFPGGDHIPSDWLHGYQLLSTKGFKRYGEIKELEPVPELVHRFGNHNIYEGWRILVKRGVTQAHGVNGQIEARLEKKKYCVLNSIHGIRLDSALDWERKVLIGIIWSSVARFYLFLTTSSWGGWHHEIHLRDGLLNLPVRFPEDTALRDRIVQIVDELRNWDPPEQDLFNREKLSWNQIKRKRKFLERDLDEAIFDLYELTEPERDLILDMCELGLEFFYREGKSKATSRVVNHPVPKGILEDLPADRKKERGLEGYLYAFLEMWNRQLESVNGEFRWQVIRPARLPMLAVIFSTQQMGHPMAGPENDDETEWHELLQRLDDVLLEPVSSRMYIDGMVRAVTDTDVFIIKRNERRLWTRSLAREDAEATLLRAMSIRQPVSQ